jgi:putative ABC transport system substrate-binding protein
LDPVIAGLVSSLQRPGGNVTGVTSLNAEVGPKRLELLHEILQGATIFALLVNPTNPRSAEATTRDLQAAAHALGLKLHILSASTEAEIEAAFSAVVGLQGAGLVIADDPFYATRSAELAELALRYAVPAVHQSREFTAAGGLAGFGGSTRESHGQAGIYTGRILKGERPAGNPAAGNSTKGQRTQ